MRKTTLLATLAALIAFAVIVGGAVAATGANLSINKQQSPRNPVHVGAILSYVIFFANSGPDIAIGTELVDTLPASFTFVSVSSSRGTCVGASNIVTCSLGDLAMGDRGTVTIDVQPTEQGRFTNSADISSATPDPNPASNHATKRTRVIP